MDSPAESAVLRALPQPAVKASPCPAWTARQWLVFGLSLLLLALGLWQQRHFFHDDAYIPLRYAARLLAGHGLTWNPGERVEGFSSPAYLFQIAALGALRIPLPVAARLLGLAYAVAIVLLWLRRKASPVMLLALVSLPGFSMWAWGGLETLSFVFWIVLATDCVARLIADPARFRSSFLLGLSLTLVALTRPEGIGVSVALLLVAWPGRRNRGAVIAVSSFLAAAAAYEVFRMVYFGDFVANAARAKTLGLDLGMRLWFAAMYASKTAPLWLGSALLAAWVFAWTKPRPWRSLIPIVPLLLAVALAAGDHMLGARLMLAPVAVLCWAATAAPWSPPAWVSRSVPVIAALCVAWQFDFVWRYPATPNPAAAVGEVAGRALESTLPPGTLVASATAGSLPYFAPSLSFIDTLGLNDRHIARQAPGPWPTGGKTDGWFALPGHWRGDGAYVLSRTPDAILFGGANGDLMPWFLGDYQIAASEAFRRDYAPWRLSILVAPASRPWLGNSIDPLSAQLPVTVYVRRDSAAWKAVAQHGQPLASPWPQSR